MINIYEVLFRSYDDFKQQIYSAKMSKYFKCRNGATYFVTDDPKNIYNAFGTSAILSITNLGPGYIFENKKFSTGEKIK